MYAKTNHDVNHREGNEKNENNENNEKNESNEINEEGLKNKFFLTDASFDLLCKAQQRIREVTELSPSLRKMINELVNPDTVNKLIERMIEALK